MPYELAFLAEKMFFNISQGRGAKHAPLPDFYIGVHAAKRGWVVATKDKGRYEKVLPYTKGNTSVSAEWVPFLDNQYLVFTKNICL